MNLPVYEITYNEETGASERLDVFVAAAVEDLTRSGAQKLIKSGKITVNGNIEKANYPLRVGDVVAVRIPPPEPTDIIAEDIPLDVVYEDSDLIVINKARGMTVHPAPGHGSGTLVNAVLGRCEELSGVGGVERPGIVHRIDKDTSGLLVVAKTDKAHLGLAEQIQTRYAHRSYYALVWGAPKFEEAEVDAPIGRHPKDRQKMAVITETERYTSREAITHLHVIERFTGFALLEATLQTGSTHQIRVHVSFIGLPVVGDPVYCASRRSIPDSYSRKEQEELRRLIEAVGGQALHAHRLEFAHPVTGKPMTFECPMPPEMALLIDWLRHHPV